MGLDRSHSGLIGLRGLRAQLGVFIRPPVPGVVKTRLADEIGEANAASIYEGFVEDTLRLCARLVAGGRIDVTLWYAGALDDRIRRWGAGVGASIHSQPDGDLGARLAHAFERGFSEYERVVIIGSDAPTLPASVLGEAFEALGGASMVLGPACDGGYYAIGAATRAPSFEGVRWSSSTALEDTVKANSDRDLAFLPPWYDVDDAPDLALLRAHLGLVPAAAPCTRDRLASIDLHK